MIFINDPDLNFLFKCLSASVDGENVVSSEKWLIDNIENEIHRSFEPSPIRNWELHQVVLILQGLVLGYKYSIQRLQTKKGGANG